MPDWEEDSPQLRQNLASILQEISQSAQRRDIATIETARQWQIQIMNGLQAEESRYVGTFRGEPGVEHVQVRVLSNYGVDSAKVAGELQKFEATLQRALVILDAQLPIGQEPDADQFAAVVDLCAWVHAEWVRIHPFANANGRTARLWANSIAMRYGIPPFVRLRPRPDGGYGQAGAIAMQGDWKPTAMVFRRLLDRYLDEHDQGE